MATEKDAKDREAGGRRAASKAERRDRLVREARRMLAKPSKDGKGFSMNQLAEAAGLSPATPFNLFGSKAAVLQAVFAKEVEGFHQSASLAEPGDPVTRILAVADLLAGEFSSRPHFYRALDRSLRDLGLNGNHAIFVPLQNALFTPMVEELAANGAFREWLPLPTIRMQIVWALEGILVDWAAEDWSAGRLTNALRLGFGLATLGCLDEPWASDMADRLRALLASPEE